MYDQQFFLICNVTAFVTKTSMKGLKDAFTPEMGYFIENSGTFVLPPSTQSAFITS